MTKDVLITISGIQMMDEEDSDVEMIVRGDYYQKNGKHYILYEEVMEGFEGKDFTGRDGYHQEGHSQHPYAV